MVCTIFYVFEIVMLLLFACSVKARTSRSSAAFKNEFIYFSLLESRSFTYQERSQTDFVLAHFTCLYSRENEKVRENLSRKRR